MTKHVRKTFAMIGAFLLLAALIAGCSSAGKSDSASDAGSAQYSGSAESLAADMKAPMNEAAPAEAPQADEAVSGEYASALANSAAGMGTDAMIADEGFNRKLIYRADLSMEVEDYVKAQSELLNRVQLAGGYVLEFSDQKSLYELGGIFTVKVPSGGFMNFIQQLEQMKHLEFSRNLQANDVTEEYVDLEARLKAKQVVEARLLSFMEKAQKADDLVRFSSELGSVQEEIERIKGRMRYLEQNVAFSTVNLRLYQTLEDADQASIKSKKPFGERISSTLSTSWQWTVAFLQGIVLFVVGALPVLVLLSIAAAVYWGVYRKKWKAKKKLAGQIGPSEQDEKKD
ncbi:DUF4349 domain-containing protein [Paenibacillus sp. MSJ-34]|uniref:DUF4349 domain-containing protein n=1 Tax=Paenibacillus sp. MSJ-34 TaxID=2841529 RepID=UPI001C120DB3|nr:DUF4349 domain-containing protein [Paenibacillus sp. MSJ-34]MBU5440511.1 DUF4349 domain-containing protein [Paenibacillus sp. MSJ-34]